MPATQTLMGGTDAPSHARRVLVHDRLLCVRRLGAGLMSRAMDWEKVRKENAKRRQTRDLPVLGASNTGYIRKPKPEARPPD